MIMAEPQPMKAEEKKEATPTQAAVAAPGEVKKVVKRKAAPKKDKTIRVRAKRKTSVARASVRPGNGDIRINGKDINALEFDIVRDMIMEPLTISDAAKDVAKKVSIKVNVYGGGTSSQMQSIRGAIAKGLVTFSGSEILKKEYLAYDRALLIDDPRRVEPKKFMGPKARARFQTSYR